MRFVASMHVLEDLCMLNKCYARNISCRVRGCVVLEKQKILGFHYVRGKAYNEHRLNGMHVDGLIIKTEESS